MDENKNIFRKTSLDRISSPERLNDYIKVSNPSVWIILAAVAVLLTAAIFWGCTAEITPDGLRPIDFLLGLVGQNLETVISHCSPVHLGTV